MITINNLSFGYRNRKLFEGLSLNLTSGSIYGLLGKNGAGKSTLLKLIAGLLIPKAGDIRVLEQIPAKRQPSLLRDIFVLPEEFDLPNMSITEYAMYYGVFYPNFNGEQMQSILKNLEVDSCRTLHTMSFGQKKKALIAFAIACNTRLLILDEPTNGLDIPSKGSFRRVIASVSNEDRTIIISTHQVRDLDQLIDRVVILDESNILLNASTDTITEKLYFTHLDAKDEAIYAEQTIHGIWGVLRNDRNLDSQMDMELLFNAVTTNHKTIKQIFE